MARWERGVIAALKRFSEFVTAICAYVDESTQDWPTGKEEMAEEVPVYGLGISICASLLREYHWPFEKTLAMPLKVSLQCLKEIQLRQGRRAFFSPSKKIINSWLLERNKTDDN